LLLLMCCITLIDLHMLIQTCNPGMKTYLVMLNDLSDTLLD
jgi:hypothetical protein